MINRNLAQRLSYLLNLTIVTVLASGFSAQAKPLVLDNKKAAVNLCVESSAQLSELLLVKNSHSKHETVSTTSRAISF